MANAPVTAGYIRVSSAKQRDASESPANQRLRLQKAGVTLIFEDLAISGYRTASRKTAEGWKRLWTAIEQGQVNRLLACRLDRYGRRDSLVMELAEHCERHGVSFETLSGGAVDLTSPSSWIAVKVELMMAEFYSRQLSANIKAAHAAAIDRKIVAFTSKHLGWQLRRIEGTRHGVEPHPDRWDDARTAIVKYIHGEWSMEAMSAWIYERHGVMKTTGSLLKWLHSHNIMGDYGQRDGKVLIAGCFPPLISEDEAALLELRLKANSRKRGSHRAAHYTYPFSGVTQCLHCESTLNYSCVKKDNGGAWYRYLRCPSRKGHCAAAGLRRPEWQVEESMQRHLERQDIDGLQALDTKPADASPSRELVEAKRRLRKLAALLDDGEDVDLRAAYAKQVDRVAELSGGQAVQQATGLQALVRRLAIGSAGWYDRLSDGERNGVWLQALDGQAPVDLLCTGEGWETRLCSPVFNV